MTKREFRAAKAVAAGVTRWQAPSIGRKKALDSIVGVFRPVLEVHVDGFGRALADGARLPVLLEALRQELVEERVDHPVELSIIPDPLVRILPVRFPPSEIYYFEPLNERVPVYQKPFTLLQEVVLAVTPQAEAAFRERTTLTINGALEYQACDDKICFNPAVVPLSWSLELKRH